LRLRKNKVRIGAVQRIKPWVTLVERAAGLKRPAEKRKSLGWLAERSNATVLRTSQQGKRSAAERERVVSSTARCEERTKPQV